MDELKALHAGTLDMRSYPDAQSVARRLMKTNPRLQEDKAQWLAQHWARPDAQGQWHVLGEAAHKIKNAYLYRWDEMQAIWQRITAPVLSIEASDDSLQQWWKGSYTLQDYHERLKNIAQVQVVRIDDAGHMLHHDQPLALAQAVETFLT
jgi:pimeloyl-ACP methyl ester carboxylesterase